MHHQDNQNRRMSQFAPLNSETVTRDPDNQALDPPYDFAAVAYCRESDLYIGHQFGRKSRRYPSPADADVANTTESSQAITHPEPDKPVDLAPMSPTVFHAYPHPMNLSRDRPTPGERDSSP
jgi:hypothetical protein